MLRKSGDVLLVIYGFDSLPCGVGLPRMLCVLSCVLFYESCGTLRLICGVNPLPVCHGVSNPLAV